MACSAAHSHQVAPRTPAGLASPAAWGGHVGGRVACHLSTRTRVSSLHTQVPSHAGTRTPGLTCSFSFTHGHALDVDRTVYTECLQTPQGRWEMLPASLWPLSLLPEQDWGPSPLPEGNPVAPGGVGSTPPDLKQREGAWKAWS